jgi:hypothetical protein
MPPEYLEPEMQVFAGRGNEHKNFSNSPNGPAEKCVFQVLCYTTILPLEVRAENSRYCGSKYSQWTSGNRVLGASSLPSMNAE